MVASWPAPPVAGRRRCRQATDHADEHVPQCKHEHVPHAPLRSHQRPVTEIAGCRLDRCHVRRLVAGYLVWEEEAVVARGWNLDSVGYRETGFDSGKE